MQAPKAREKILGYFVRKQHLTSSISNSRGGATAPGCPASGRLCSCMFTGQHMCPQFQEHARGIVARLQGVCLLLYEPENGDAYAVIKQVPNKVSLVKPDILA